jgi:hypothetical protein
MDLQEIRFLPQNRNLKRIESLGVGDDIQLRVEGYEFQYFNIDIIKAQWTKTQFTYGIRVYNYFTGKRPDLQICNYTKKTALAFIQELKDNGSASLWTGHHVDAGEFIQ